jgi:epoxyqueuosine reductase
MRADEVKRLAAECGFELCGITPAAPLAEAAFYQQWVDRGFAAGMHYLTDRRAQLRQDPRTLLPSARSIICVAKLYNTPHPYSIEPRTETAWISRYAWGADYHDVLRAGLDDLAARMQSAANQSFEWKVCVDTAPLLERAYARHAGLGWIGRNSCLIHEGAGSWFFLGELLISLDLEADSPPPDRCGTCTRCIEICPTQAIVPAPPPGPEFTVDSRRCISYFTIEAREPAPEELRRGIGGHVFGCDLCQDVCPWNWRAPITAEPAFHPRDLSPPLERLASLTEEEFRAAFRGTPVMRAKYVGFLRNVALAMGNSPRPEYRPALERLAASDDVGLSTQARWSLERLGSSKSTD